MQWEIYPHEDNSGDWVVEGVNFSGDGEIQTTIFSGTSAESRAKQYLAWASAPELVAA